MHTERKEIQLKSKGLLQNFIDRLIEHFNDTKLYPTKTWRIFNSECNGAQKTLIDFLEESKINYKEESQLEAFTEALRTQLLKYIEALRKVDSKQHFASLYTLITGTIGDRWWDERFWDLDARLDPARRATRACHYSMDESYQGIGLFNEINKHLPKLQSDPSLEKTA